MTAIVVLGMHRSGTSLVAGLLHHLGVFMGEGLENGDPWPHYEDPAFVSLNQSLLTSAGGSWRKPPPTESIWRFSHQCNERIQRLLRERSAHDSWGFKDPRTCLTVNLWHHHLCLWSPPRYVMVWRERERIVASLLQRAKARGDDDKTEVEWVQLVGFYWGRVLNFLSLHHPPYHAVWYDEILSRGSSEESVRELAEFCEVDYNPDVLKLINRGSCKCECDCECK